MRILYVEDNPTDADLTRRSLLRHDPGCSVDVAGSLAEARSRLDQSGPYDVVLSDVNLPDGTGPELVSEIRERGVPSAVVMLTGTGDTDTVVAALKAGADDYLVKGSAQQPLLSQTIESALARFRSEAARKPGILHLLYFEPDAGLAQATRQHLEKHAPNIRLEVVADAGGLLRRINHPADQSCPCDVLLLECRVEGETSLDVLKALLLDGRLHAPVVMLGREGDEQLAAHALRLGASVHYLVKHANYLNALPATLEGAHRAALLTRKEAEKTEAERAARRSEDRYRSLFANMFEGFVYGRMLLEEGEPQDFVILEVNSAFATLTGLEGVVGRRVTEAIPGIRESNPELFQHYGRVAATGRPEQFETYVGPLGAWFAIAAYRPAEGDFVAVFDNITERKRAEERLQEEKALVETLLRSLPGIVYVVDGDGRLVRWNRNYEQVVGRTREELRGADALQPIVDEDKARLAAKIRDVLEQGGFEQAEARLRDASGELRDYIFSAQRVEIGGAPLLVGTGLDVTDRRLAQEAHQHLESQLRQSQKLEAVGRLAGGVAHDFNNMLNVILGYAELALRSLSPVDPMRKRLEGIQNAAERSADLTKRLLAFSRRQTIAPRVLDLNAQTKGMEGLLRRIIGEDIDLLFSLPEGLWPVSMDPSQVDQVVANLAVNARDAMPDGGKLTIETGNATLDAAYCKVHPEARPGDYVMLAVSDSGCGMDARTLERVFEPFFTTKPEGKGTGLGLAMVYGIARQNEGSIKIYSEPGEGTTVKLYLPRCTRAAEPLPDAPPAAATQRGHETVLLVEDETSLRELVQALLEELGYRVLAAATPGEAISLCEKHTGAIQLLLTDVVMPVMSGKELSERIRALKPAIRVLFTSGYTANAIAHRGVLDPGLDFLSKPFSLDALANKVRAALSR